MNIFNQLNFKFLRLSSWTDLNESPKLVFKDACQIIGKELSKDGYTYYKSKKLISSKSKNGEFDFLIFLNTTSFNEKGKKVNITISCAITSSKMGELRNRYFKLSDDVVTSFHPGYLSKKKNWIEWNLIKVHPLNIVRFLKKTALPAFEKFECPDKLVVELNGKLPDEFDYHFRAIDFLILYSSKQNANDVLLNYLEQKKWKEEFYEILDLVKHGHKPEKKHRALIVLLAERAVAFDLLN